MYFLSLYKHTVSDMISFWQIMNEVGMNKVGTKTSRNEQRCKKYRTQQNMPLSLFWVFCTFSLCYDFSLLFLNIYPHIYQICTYHMTSQPLKYMLIPKIPNKLPETVRKQMIPVLIADWQIA